ncbi:RND transporter, partial [Paraburkholderia sp. SIMBA_054]
MRRAPLTTPLATGLVSALCVLALSGCLLGPNYSRPPLDVPATYRFPDNYAADIANTEWWKQFDDPVL